MNCQNYDKQFLFDLLTLESLIIFFDDKLVGKKALTKIIV